MLFCAPVRSIIVMPPIQLSSNTIRDGVLVISFTGSYPSGGAGNSSAEWMYESGKVLVADQRAKALVVDLRELRYDWGDMIELVYDIGCSCEPTCAQVTVVSSLNRRALSTLEWGEDTKRDITELPEFFDSIEEAVEFASRSASA
jgi:hypothetical protein